MTSKSNGANHGAVIKLTIRPKDHAPPKRRPYAYEKDDDDLLADNRNGSTVPRKRNNKR